MKQQTVCILFGGMSPEHEVSLRSAECILNNIDREKYHVVPVGITRAGQWLYYAGTDYRELPAQTWQDHPDNRPAAISPVRGQGLLIFEGDSVVRQHIDVVFPVLHGENGEDGSVQGLLQLAGIAYVGPHVAASAIAMDKSMTKLVADRAGVRQAGWELVTDAAFAHHPEELLDRLEAHFAYPVFVKPAGTGSSVGVSKAKDRAALQAALVEALRFDRKVLVEVYQAIGCQGLSRVDFFVTYQGDEVVFNEINTIPGFTSISMYPKLFEASGIACTELIDQLLACAMEADA